MFRNNKCWFPEFCLNTTSTYWSLKICEIGFPQLIYYYLAARFGKGVGFKFFFLKEINKFWKNI